MQVITTFLCCIKNVFLKFKRILKQSRLFRTQDSLFSLKAKIPQKYPSLGFKQTWTPPAKSKYSTKATSWPVDLTRHPAPKPTWRSPLLQKLQKPDLCKGQGWHSGGVWSEQSPQTHCWNVSQALGLPPPPFRELNISLCQNKLGRPQIFSSFLWLQWDERGEWGRERWKWEARERQCSSHESTVTQLHACKLFLGSLGIFYAWQQWKQGSSRARSPTFRHSDHQGSNSFPTLSPNTSRHALKSLCKWQKPWPFLPWHFCSSCTWLQPVYLCSEQAES